VNETSLEKGTRSSLREKGQYALAFGIIAVMLYVVGFPVFILIFLGVLAFFIWKAFTAGSDNQTKRIFDFYLSASEILKDDGRRWFGFEVAESIAKGEDILTRMATAPPLVHFALGALHQASGDHSSAVRQFEKVFNASSPDEMAIVFPTKELREYVRILRKIERSPSEAPLTSSSVRFLERMRKNKGLEMLESSRATLDAPVQIKGIGSAPEAEAPPRFKQEESTSHPAQPDRTTISELLHEIYDKNIQ
jgi:hypothetical protein